MVARVLWLTKGLGLGGAERLLSLMAPRLDGSRFEVDVAYVLTWKEALVGDLTAANVDVVCLGANRTLDPRWIVRLRRHLKVGRYDIVHTHSPVPAAAARIVARPATVLVHTEHNVWERYRWVTYAVNAATYRRNAAVIAVSDGVADSIVQPRWVGRRPYPPVETLHHGVNVDEVQRRPEARMEARRRLGLPLAAPVIGTVANFTPKKDHAGLLVAVNELSREFPDLVLLLVGSGPLEDELRDDVRTHGLTEHVRFLGSRSDVLDLLPALDVFVLGSRFEGLPISLLEAMAACVPCVATNVGGIPEVIENAREGFLVPPGQPAELAIAVRHLLTDPNLRASMGATGLERVRTHFSIGRAVSRIEDVYADLLGGPIRR